MHNETANKTDMQNRIRSSSIELGDRKLLLCCPKCRQLNRKSNTKQWNRWLQTESNGSPRLESRNPPDSSSSYDSPRYCFSRGGLFPANCSACRSGSPERRVFARRLLAGCCQRGGSDQPIGRQN